MDDYAPYPGAPGMPGRSRYDPAQLFRDMAERIDKVKDSEFAGAILIVPPASDDGESHAVEVLIVDPFHVESHFWHVVKVRSDLAMGLWAQREAVPPPGGYR